MLILMVVASFTLLVLGITRAACRDWRRCGICLIAGAILFIMFVHHARQFHSDVKKRAKEYAQKHPKISEQKDGTETRRLSND